MFSMPNNLSVFDKCVKYVNQQAVRVVEDIGDLDWGGVEAQYSIATLKAMFDCFCIIRHEE